MLGQNAAAAWVPALPQGRAISCVTAGFHAGFGAHCHFLSICCEIISILGLYLFKQVHVDFSNLNITRMLLMATPKAPARGRKRSRAAEPASDSVAELSARLEQILDWTCICKAVVFEQWNF